MLKWFCDWVKAEIMILTICRRMPACLKWRSCRYVMHIFLDQSATGQFRHEDRKLLAGVNTMLTSYRRTKYINIYKTYICLQCFCYNDALALNLFGLPRVCFFFFNFPPQPDLTGSVWWDCIFASCVPNPSSSHLRRSQKSRTIISSLFFSFFTFRDITHNWGTQQQQQQQQQ